MSDGILELTPKHRLQFSPTIYPTTQAANFGFKWNSKEKVWLVNFSYRALREISTEFTLDYGKNLSFYLQAFPYSVQPKESLRNSKLHPYQQKAAQFLIDNKRVLFGFSPRLGKTPTAILASQEVGKRVLVICPLTLVMNWRLEIEKWTGCYAVEFWYKHPDNWQHGVSWVVTNYDTAVRYTDEFIKENFDVIIYDESVTIKNRKTNRTKKIKQLTKKTPYVWLLSGAPTTKFYDDLWAQLNILDPKQFGSYWQFVNSYCHTFTDQWGTRLTGNKKEASEWLKEDLRFVYYSRTLEQITASEIDPIEFPEWDIEDIYCPMGKIQYKSYLEMETQFLATLPDSDDSILAMSQLSQLTRLIQLASNTAILGGSNHGAKWDALQDMLEYVEKPCIVWTTYKLTASMVAESLKGYTVKTLTGDTKVSDRQAIVEAFQAGEIDVLIAHPAVGKFGLTLSAGKAMVYLERGFNFDDYWQSLFRLYGQENTQRPKIYHLIALTPDGKPTVDSTINRVLNYRQGQTVKLTAGLLKENWKTI